MVHRNFTLPYPVQFLLNHSDHQLISLCVIYLISLQHNTLLGSTIPLDCPSVQLTPAVRFNFLGYHIA